MWSNDLILFCSTLLLSIGVIAAMLVFYLSIKQGPGFGQRVEKDAPPRNGFDIRPLSPRLRRLRADYVREVHLRPRAVSHRRERIDSARRLVARLPYFRDAAVVQEQHELR